MKYMKTVIPMESQNNKYILWKSGVSEGRCMLEEYKEKRGISLAVRNILPTEVLREENKEYRVLLMGSDSGEIIYKELGILYVNNRGDGQLIKRFSGAQIKNYTHCLVIAVRKDTEITENVLVGKSPYFKENEESGFKENEEPDAIENGRTKKKSSLYEKLSDLWEKGDLVEIFDEEIDETGAKWKKAEWEAERDLLKAYPYGHIIIGKYKEALYMGIPGRFLKKEQPDEDVFCLWQPIKGGEFYYTSLQDMDEEVQQKIFGYWICQVNKEDGRLLPL